MEGPAILCLAALLVIAEGSPVQIRTPRAANPGPSHHRHRILVDYPFDYDDYPYHHHHHHGGYADAPFVGGYGGPVGGYGGYGGHGGGYGGPVGGYGGYEGHGGGYGGYRGHGGGYGGSQAQSSASSASFGINTPVGPFSASISQAQASSAANGGFKRR